MAGRFDALARHRLRDGMCLCGMGDIRARWEVPVCTVSCDHIPYKSASLVHPRVDGAYPSPLQRDGTSCDLSIRVNDPSLPANLGGWASEFDSSFGWIASYPIARVADTDPHRNSNRNITSLMSSPVKSALSTVRDRASGS